MNSKKTFTLFVVFTVATLGAGTPKSAVAKTGTGGTVVFYVDWGDNFTHVYEMPFKTEAELYRATVNSLIFEQDVAGLKEQIVVIRDPSIGYNLEVTNSTTETQDIFSTVQFPINPLAANTLSAELLVNLIDANSNGQVALTGSAGGANAIQAVNVAGVPIGPPLGAAITTPGVHSFVLDPVSGPTPAGNMLQLRTNFSLSPGDTAHITSRFIIDEHTGIPFAEIPDLPNPADGPFFNVIDIDSPETSLGNNLRIGAQTQLNLMAGGSIGEDFSAGDRLFLTPDIEVNFSGGTMGDDFRTFNESVANITGGTTGDVLMFDNSTVNVFGGNVVGGIVLQGGTANFSAGVTGGGFRIFEGNINISGGTVGGFSGVQAAGGVTTISGGTFNSTVAILPDGGDINISGGTFNNHCGICANPASDSVVTISGGEFTGRFYALQTLSESEVIFNIFGGTFAPHIDIRGDNNELHFFGTEFLLDGVPIDGLEHGEAFEITGRDITLTGTLADGSPLSIDLNSVSATGQDHVSAAALLTLTLILPGDYNDDGIVNAGDYVAWRNNVGADASLPNDITPWSIGPEDYGVWKRNFGKTVSGAGATAHNAVPEATTAALLALGLLTAPIQRWRR